MALQWLVENVLPCFQQFFTTAERFFYFRSVMQDLQAFFREDFSGGENAKVYHPMQIGARADYRRDALNWEGTDIVLLGCDAGGNGRYAGAADAVREKLYEMYAWHPAVQIRDIGNIREGATEADTRAALRTVLNELHRAGKTVVLIGGGHDLKLEQYDPFRKNQEIITATTTDMLVDLEEQEMITEKSYLMDLLTSQPNFIRHYNHIGFQSYYVQPKMLESLDKLRFDFYRLGKVREQMEEMEPVLRHTHLYSFDMNAVRFSDAPANIHGSPNGFTGDEACLLTRYAGMGSMLSSFGLYGYDPRADVHGMTAALAAQMIWYFVDGFYVRSYEAQLQEKESFLTFYVTMEEQETVFMKSKKTGRWWMQIPDEKWIPCSYQDYKMATENQLPERWLREQERLI